MWLYSLYTTEPGKIRLKYNHMFMSVGDFKLVIGALPEALRSTFKYETDMTGRPYFETIQDARRMMFAFEAVEFSEQEKQDFRLILEHTS